MAGARPRPDRRVAPLAPDELRRRAEERLGRDSLDATSAAAPAVSANAATIIHELRVHQIELEMQNEELRRTQLDLEASREKYYELFNLAPLGYLTITDKGIIGVANLAASCLLGVERQLLLGQPFTAFVFAADRDAFYLAYRRLQQTGEPQTCELRLQRIAGEADGHAESGHFWAHLEWRPQRSVAGEPPHCRLTFTDIHEKVMAEEEMARALSQLESTMESTADGILIADGKGEMVRFNARFGEMWGIPEAIAASRDDNAALDFVLTQLKEPEVFLQTVRDLYDAPELTSFDVLQLHDGRVFERYSQPQRAGDAVAGRVWSFRDVTAREQAEEQLKQRNQQLLSLIDELLSKTAALEDANTTISKIAATDDLTGLANRRHFNESLGKAVSLARRHGGRVALVSFDLDGLKHVNDSAGHAVGDQVLTTFATLLSDLCRAEDLPGRLGGDEFGLLLPSIDLRGAGKLAERVLTAVRSCAELARLAVTVSGGIAVWSPDDLADDLLRRADEALYAAKRGGGDSVATEAGESRRPPAD